MYPTESREEKSQEWRQWNFQETAKTTKLRWILLQDPCPCVSDVIAIAKVEWEWRTQRVVSRNSVFYREKKK